MTRTIDLKRTRADGGTGLLLGALGLIALFALATWWGDRETRALGALPAPERQALYRRTLDTLRTVCAGPDAASVESVCRSQAELALRLPECDADCQRLARGHLAQPAR